MPTVLAYTGSNIGGGIAIGLQHTHRIGASNMSAAFGNISRGACPVMFLSRNLPLTVGLKSAVEIYLTDTTVSACAAERCGLIYQVLSTFQQVKNQATVIAKQWAMAPGDLRNVVRAWKEYEMGHYRREGKGMTIAMSTGKMFANVKSVRTKSAAASGSEPAAAKVPPEEVRVARAANTSRPIPVTGSAAACGQCGDQNVDGIIYGDSFFCESCWPLMGYAKAAQERPSAAPLAAKPVAKWPCAQCEVSVAKGTWGADDLWYCNACTKAWARRQPGSSSTGTDSPTADLTDASAAESGEEGTIIDSDAVICSGTEYEGSDVERDVV